MDLGFVGLGNMGAPIAARLIAAGHRLTVFDIDAAAVARTVGQGAVAAGSPTEVAERAATVLMSLPTPKTSEEVVAAVAAGSRVERLIDLSTTGSAAAVRNRERLDARGAGMLDCPVSGGVAGATNGALTVMVSGPRALFDSARDVLETLGRPLFVGEKPGAAQTMKLVNNLMAACSLAATAEVAVMGVKSGLDPTVMIEVLNAGSGATHASRDKFPRSILPRTFDYGFATGLMVKDLRLYLEEAQALSLPTALASTVLQVWETVLTQQGPDSDFTSVVKPYEAAAGVVVDGRPR
ncbi:MULTISPECIES: NAD(P)-dependent oxidoreductase [Mycobacteriaceae]|uniref:NAD(P)-dependent oxidoreductase n=1 Tax=Mycobacteriaceae TaxID=1762 RepID=UPI0007FCEABE|nr:MULTISPECIES: NAD(P)-dependent oxidoreductase [Mycobacteriaceae]MCK0176627.1 NAD(P)-dependent oxidoreductase [Mycolicibacterium sp. F2034L]OBB55976.1 oxidoreductase [Mycobacterium sp. 852013-51886_SCH5428379]